MTDYKFVNVLDRASIADYLALFERVYGPNEKLTSAYLNWLYIDNPHGRAVGFDAFLNGELAAHYVTIPRVYRIGEELVPGVLSVNTATHPNHQRKGLFTRLATATYERAARNGYRYVVGVANAQSIHGFINKLEFNHIGQIGLALWRRPPQVPAGYACLDQTPSWLRWRLANPSANYFATSAEDGDIIINARRGRTVFSLGRAPSHVASSLFEQTPKKFFRGPTTLTPVFPKEKFGPLLPERLMPSPWHIIFRQLGPKVDGMSQIHFDGLSMDSF